MQPSQELLDSIANDERLCEKAFADKPHQFSHEPYRRKLALMSYRLERNLRVVGKRLDGEAVRTPKTAYPSEADFLKDLGLIRDSLISHGDRNIAEGKLKDLIRVAETFGFYLVQLDLRQESSRHTDAVTEIMAAVGAGADYAQLDETQRLQALADGLSAPSLPALNVDKLSESTQETLAALDVMARMRREVSPKAFGNYVISMTHAASHIMEVLYLARYSGLAGPTEDGWYCEIRISPLFETIEDLEHVESVTHPTAGQSSLRRAAQDVRQCPGSHARLFRFLQGRRHSRFGMEPVRSPETDYRADRRPRHRLPAVPWPRRNGRSWRRPDP